MNAILGALKRPTGVVLDVLKSPTWVVTGLGLVGALLIAWGLVYMLERPERAFERQIVIVLGLIAVAPLFIFYRFGLLVFLFVSLVGEPFPGAARVVAPVGIVVAGRRFLDLMMLGRPLHGVANATVLWASLFVGAVAVSLVNAADLYAGAIGLATQIQLVVMVILVIDFVRSGVGIRWLMLMFVLAALVNAVIATYELFLGGDLGSEIRVEGSIGNANRFAAHQLILLCLVLPTIGYLKSLVLRMLLLVWVAVVLLTIVLTASRGAFVATIAALGVFFFLGGRSALRAKILIAVALLGFAVLLPFLPSETFFERIAKIPTSQEEAQDRHTGVGARLLYLESGIRMGLDHPWTGIGIRQFASSLQVYAPRQQPKGPSAHNMYVSVFAETGFPGLIILLGMLLSALSAAWKSEGGLASELRGSLAVAVQVALIAFMVYGLFGALESSKPAWMLIALAASLQARSRRPNDGMIS
jgi:O-antigen ligase